MTIVREQVTLELYSKLARSGATIYRKSGDTHVYLVPPSASHSEAWRAVAGPIR